MTISKEVRIGILVTTAIVIFFAGFYFLKGSDVFSNDKEYYCYYNNVDGLQKSSIVQIKGFNVGNVSNMELVGAKGVKVTLSINGSTQLPKGTVASLASSDLLGTKVIRLDMGTSTEMVDKGATLLTVKDLNVVDQVSGELTPRLEELKETIATFNVTIARVNSIINTENQNNISATLASIKTTSENLARITSNLDKESGQISGIIRNTNSISANLAQSNDTIKRILANRRRRRRCTGYNSCPEQRHYQENSSQHKPHHKPASRCPNTKNNRRPTKNCGTTARHNG